MPMPRPRTASRITTSLAVVAFVLSVTAVARAGTLNLPGQYLSLSASVTAATAGDTILVDDGTYSGSADGSLTIQSVNGPSKTIIDAGFTGSLEFRMRALVKTLGPPS
jgi:hypothetical protein